MNPFDTWNTTKQYINYLEKTPHVREREIYWCSIGQNIGYEINGKTSAFTRPVIILKKISPRTILIAPTTTKVRAGSWFLPINFAGFEENICINQIRTIDTKRLGKMVARISETKFENIIKSIKSFYFSNI
jgi:mRNA interferase MazF